MTIDCVIPARGVSTRLPRKNLAIVEGRPLLTYAIEAALGSMVFGHVYVSTEDPEIGEVAVRREPNLCVLWRQRGGHARLCYQGRMGQASRSWSSNSVPDIQ